MSSLLNRINTNKNILKNNNINLKKGQKIDLKKSDNRDLSSFCVGANWGAIKSTSFLGKIKNIPVDLDLSVATFDHNNQVLDVVYFGKLSSQGILHYGDDLVGDTDGDDGFDNEIININLKQLPHNASQVVFILNSYQQQDFATVPFASIRLYEGNEKHVKKVFASYNIASEEKYAGHVSMVLGKLYQNENKWEFKALGEPTTDTKLQDTILTIQKNFL